LAKGTIEGLAKGGFVGMVRGFKKAGDVRLGVGAFVGAGTGAAAAGPVDELIPGKVQQEGPWIPGLRQQSWVFDEPSPEILEEVPGVGFGPAQLEQEREHGVAVVIEDLFKRVHAGSMDRTPLPRGFV
jgi:hypothetical protein